MIRKNKITGVVEWTNNSQCASVATAEVQKMPLTHTWNNKTPLVSLTKIFCIYKDSKFTNDSNDTKWIYDVYLHFRCHLDPPGLDDASLAQTCGERLCILSRVFLKSVCSGAQRFITLFVMLTGTRCYPGAVTGVLIAIALRLYFGACVV